jgi:hypothetical protein
MYNKNTTIINKKLVVSTMASEVGPPVVVDAGSGKIDWLYGIGSINLERKAPP